MSKRNPQPETPSRISPLATLPVFLKLKGKRAVLAGASEGALWKAELLAASGADLDVFAPGFSDAFVRLAAFPPAGSVTLHPQSWQAADLIGAAVAIADIETRSEAESFVAAACKAGAAYNVIDKPEFCAFQFGAIVNRSPLIISISTDGAAPVLGQAIRAKIEAMLPVGFKVWAQAARDWRPFVQRHALGYAARRLFWERFTARALAAPERIPGEDDRIALLDTLSTIEVQAGKGRVSLVGAGPGDPELLTLKAVRLLQSADVILHDDLVSPEVLEMARREAKRIRVGKKGHGPSCRQGEICDLIVALAREGQHVVRLKGGDPAIFGRATEELDACAAAGIPVSIVPGITAAQGAAASLGLSLTERRVARRLQFVTGHSQDGTLPDNICWSAVADESVTTVLYMPRRTLVAFCAGAVAAGLARATPAVAVMNATRTNEKRLVATLESLPEYLAARGDEGPVLVLIGRVMARLSVEDALAAAA